jgi:chitin deacetylase
MTPPRRRAGNALLVLAAAASVWFAACRPHPRSANAPVHTAKPVPKPQPPVVAARVAPTVAVPRRYRGQVLRQRVRHFPEKLLALTFDDGPDPQVTPVVLATLKRHEARATFFVLGRNVRRWPELVRQAAAEGHAIGSHAYSHPERCSPAEARRQLAETANLIEQANGQRPTLFRPPYGITTGNLCEAALGEDYTAVLWTISSADSRPISAVTIAQNVIHTPNPGDIVLMHDGAGHAATAKALEQILTEGVTACQFATSTRPWARRSASATARAPVTRLRCSPETSCGRACAASA